MKFILYFFISLVFAIPCSIFYAAYKKEIIPLKLSTPIPEGWEQYEIERSGEKLSALMSKEFLIQSKKPVVFCIHGFPDISSTWQYQLNISEHEYRIFAPSLRGYDPSNANLNVTLEALSEDTLFWLNHFQIASAHFIGHDWGSIIVYYVCVRQSSVCESMTLVAVPPLQLPSKIYKYPWQLLYSSYMLFFQLPYLPEAVIQYNDWAYIYWIYSVWSPNLKNEVHMMRVKEALSQKNVLSNALGYYRTIIIQIMFNSIFGYGDFAEVFQTKNLPVPTLAVTGANDGCILSEYFEDSSKEFKSNLVFLRIEDAGHFAHMEKPETFNYIFLEFISSAMLSK